MLLLFLFTFYLSHGFYDSDGFIDTSNPTYKIHSFDDREFIDKVRGNIGDNIIYVYQLPHECNLKNLTINPIYDKNRELNYSKIITFDSIHFQFIIPKKEIIIKIKFQCDQEYFHDFIHVRKWSKKEGSLKYNYNVHNNPSNFNINMEFISLFSNIKKMLTSHYHMMIHMINTFQHLLNNMIPNDINIIKKIIK